MPSLSLQTWLGAAAQALDEIEAAHAAVGGVRPGRRYTTQQINHAYVVLLSSQFQRFCRDLHSEAADHIAAAVASASVRDIVRAQLTGNRRLDTGNPNPGNLGNDFARFNLDFWKSVLSRDRRNADRKSKLEFLNKWRNAIAHQDFDPSELGGRTELRLSDVRQWRAVCVALAGQFDETIRVHLSRILGATPW